MYNKSHTYKLGSIIFLSVRCLYSTYIFTDKLLSGISSDLWQDTTLNTIWHQILVTASKWKWCFYNSVCSFFISCKKIKTMKYEFYILKSIFILRAWCKIYIYIYHSSCPVLHLWWKILFINKFEQGTCYFSSKIDLIFITRKNTQNIAFKANLECNRI